MYVSKIHGTCKNVEWKSGSATSGNKIITETEIRFA